METNMNITKEKPLKKIDVFFVLETFDFFFFILFCLCMWALIFLFLFLIGIYEPKNTNPNHSKNYKT